MHFVRPLFGVKISNVWWIQYVVVDNIPVLVVKEGSSMSPRTSPPGASIPPVANKSTKAGRGFRRLGADLLPLSVLLTRSYAALSIYIATQLVYPPQVPLYATPASLDLHHTDVN